jgi:hypothetical protein
MWRRLGIASERLEVSASVLERQRPWLASMTLIAALV